MNRIDPNMPIIGQIWQTHKAGDRWRVDEHEPHGETATVRMVAVNGRHAGKPDVLFVGELRECAFLVKGGRR
jgi:hypothetical protein